MKQYDLEQIQKEYAELQTILENQQGHPVVAVWGLMNAGKSYLLNMLTRHLDKEYFKTNDIRETAEVKTLEFGNIIYLDTPGLDAKDADDLEAMRGVAHADVVLFVHQPQGELEKIEMDFLHRLRTSFGKHAKRNIILIISKVDKESPDKIQEIEYRMLEQCEKELGFVPRCFQISNTRFHKGMNEHKNALTQASHINELNEYVQQVARESKGVNKQRAKVKLKHLLGVTDKMIAAAMRQKQNVINNFASEFTQFNQMVDELAPYRRDKAQQYSDLREALECDREMLEDL